MINHLYKILSSSLEYFSWGSILKLINKFQPPNKLLVYLNILSEYSENNSNNTNKIKIKLNQIK